MDADKVLAIKAAIESENDDFKWPGIGGNMEGRRVMLALLLKEEAITTDTYMLGLLLTDITEGLNK